MQASVAWKSELAFDGASGSHHSVPLDGSPDHAAGASPMELVLLGLCGCTASDIVSILKKMRQPFTGLTVSAAAERAADPPRVFTHIQLVYRVQGAVSKKAMEDATRLTQEKYCSVVQMLSKTAKIEYTIEYAPA